MGSIILLLPHACAIFISLLIIVIPSSFTATSAELLPISHSHPYSFAPSQAPSPAPSHHHHNHHSLSPSPTSKPPTHALVKPPAYAPAKPPTTAHAPAHSPYSAKPPTKAHHHAHAPYYGAKPPTKAHHHAHAPYYGAKPPTKAHHHAPAPYYGAKPPTKAHAPAPYSAKPPTKAPAPYIKPLPRKLVAVQGVVYCKNCSYAGVDTLLGASPLAGATVELRCRNTKYTIKKTSTTDKNGYFFLQAPKYITTYGVHKCRVFLIEMPKKGGPCSHATNLNGGLSGAFLFFNKKLAPPPKPLPYSLFTVGPLAFEPPKCYKH